MPEMLFLYECPGQHRIYSTQDRQDMKCSRCGGDYVKIADVPRKDDETDIDHKIRTLDLKPERVN